MSSETSTDPQALQTWQLFTLAGLLGATAVVVVSRGPDVAAVILLSLIVFAAAAVGVAAFRTVGPFARPERWQRTQVLGGRTRAALEREKQLTLRAIKELEFDRAMGKLSDKDFQEMSGRLRARAAGLIRQLDAGAGYRADIERELRRRLDTHPGAPAVTSNVSAVPPSVAAVEDLPAPATAVGGSDEAPVPDADNRTCAACGARNDPDARFCKHCGAGVQAGA